MKKAVLDGDVSYHKAKTITEQVVPTLKNKFKKIEKEYYTKETFEKESEKEPYHSSEVIGLLVGLFRGLEPIYVDNIKDKIENEKEIIFLVFLLIAL